AVNCPVCGGGDVVSTVEREPVPAMQNYVFRTREHALKAAAGRLTIAACRWCGFAWNTSFDPTLIVYDEGDDNTVASAVMVDYYGDLAAFLADRYELGDGLVVDVGCGNGDFLRVLCAATGGRGLGIDPALPASCEEQRGRVRFVKDVFTPDA